ncbi:MAG: 2,3-bisphosphoglycerate-independent phosphoglycerate mutase [Proteobacteria bacterium]|jgi:2,3-bisphosphoglycerate-independent phosphoglycerate mutase|nr:2,3-bisphosphoglycerate-independent phosphoglycerate mutase [Pseudomonadota bacterium]
MTNTLNKLGKFNGIDGPLLLIIADGVGVAPHGPANAVALANTPTLDKLAVSDWYTELKAHGTAVGLPSDDDMGNSEVGHNALGAGRIFAQGAKLVNAAIADGSVFESAVWQAACEKTLAGGTLHLLGLHSDGNVHSHNDHMYALLKQAAQRGIKRARLHLLLDGRDVPPRSALDYIDTTETVLEKINQQFHADYRIASGGGRMRITMDRYQADWDMVKRGYDCHVHGVGRAFDTARQAVETLYQETDKGDQYLEPFVIHDTSKPDAIGKIVDGDCVVLYNFRGDRAIQISQAFESVEFDKFDRGQHPNTFFAGMLQYDGDLKVPGHYLVDPPRIDRTMGEFLCATGLRSFAISETQKYGHVTFFWNGNRSGYVDEKLETYVEIPSDNIEFDQAPAMKAREITDKTIELLETGKFQWGRLNFANGDMVGHTGNVEAAITAMEVVDECVEKLIKVVHELNGAVIYTADHGNADIMFTDKDGVRSPKTSHTLNPVPLAISFAQAPAELALTPPDNAGLVNVAATVINLLGYQAPDDYQPSLLSVK